MNRWIAAIVTGVFGLGLAVALPADAAQQERPRQERRQRQGPRGDRAMDRLETALKKLSLNADQQAKTKKLVEETRAELKKIDTGPGTPEEKRTRSRTATRALNQKLRPILTQEQAQKLREELGGRRGERRRPPAGAGRPQ